MRRRSFIGITLGSLTALFTRLTAQESTVPVPVFAPPDENQELVPLTGAWMNEVYESLCSGNRHPTHIHMTQARFEELFKAPYIASQSKFREAEIICWESKTPSQVYGFSDHHVLFVNRLHPRYPGGSTDLKVTQVPENVISEFSIYARIGRSKWHNAFVEKHLEIAAAAQVRNDRLKGNEGKA